MNAGIRRDGLDRFLTAIYGEKTSLAGMLDSLGFDPGQRAALCEDHIDEIAGQFVDAVRKKLTYEDKDLWFRLLAHRYGLDGEPPVSIDEAAIQLNVDLSYAEQAEGEALQKCRYKTTLQDLKKELHRIALTMLSRAGERPVKQDVIGKLDRLADLRAAVDLTRMDYEAKRNAILQKVQAELDALELEYGPVLEAAQGNASTLEAEIKNDVLLAGQSVSGKAFQAIYARGRISWDNDGMNGYARSHPEVLKFRKEGQPSVTLRMVGK